MTESTLCFMIKSQDKAARELYAEATKKKPSLDKLRKHKKEATWHTEQILKKVKEIENEES